MVLKKTYVVPSISVIPLIVPRDFCGSIIDMGTQQNEDVEEETYNW